MTSLCDFFFLVVIRNFFFFFLMIAKYFSPCIHTLIASVKGIIAFSEKITVSISQSVGKSSSIF